jgi:hypothetical protein
MSTPERQDPPRVLLAISIFVFGASRPEWGRAMLAELAELSDRRARRGFALGCARSLAFTMPPRGATRVVTIGAFLAGAASLAIVAVGLVRYPGLVSGARAWVAVGVFSTLIVLYVVAAARLGAQLLDGYLLRTAVVAGAAIASSWLAIGLDASEDGSEVLSMVLLGLGPLVAVASGWHATARSGSTRVGFLCVGITALVAGFALFLLWAGETVLTGGQPYDTGLLRDFGTSGAPDLATYAVDDSLGTGMMLLLLVPLVSVTTGLVGAAAATRKTFTRKS